MKKTTRFAIVIALTLFSFTAEACPMCQAGATEEYISAYKITTAILVLIPLTTVAILIVWIWRKTKSSY